MAAPVSFTVNDVTLLLPLVNEIIDVKEGVKSYVIEVTVRVRSHPVSIVPKSAAFARYIEEGHDIDIEPYLWVIGRPARTDMLELLVHKHGARATISRLYQLATDGQVKSITASVLADIEVMMTDHPGIFDEEVKVAPAPVEPVAKPVTRASASAAKADDVSLSSFGYHYAIELPVARLHDSLEKAIIIHGTDKVLARLEYLHRVNERNLLYYTRIGKHIAYIHERMADAC
jgi:hypothetical protein